MRQWWMCWTRILGGRCSLEEEANLILRLLDHLEATGELDNTFILFSEYPDHLC